MAEAKRQRKQRAFQDISGQIFTWLTVLGHAGQDKDFKHLWRCRCKCGRETTVSGKRLRSGHTQSCGYCGFDAERRRACKPRLPVPLPDGSVGIPLTKGKMAVIDRGDLDLVGRFLWCASKGTSTWYAATKLPKGRMISMHVLIMGTTWIDHRDGDGLNNRRSNIRCATRAQNHANSRKRANARYRFIGVFANGKKWCARYRDRHLGTFRTEEEAAAAHDEAVKKEWGEFAKLNFPDHHQLLYEAPSIEGQPAVEKSGSSSIP